VVVELIVFSSNEGELQIRGDFVVGNDDSFFDGEFADNFIVVGVNAGNHIGLIILKPLDGRKIIFIAEQNSKSGSQRYRGNDEESKEQSKPQGEQTPSFTGSFPASQCHNQ
jgi:hypothetical protein